MATPEQELGYSEAERERLLELMHNDPLIGQNLAAFVSAELHLGIDRSHITPGENFDKAKVEDLIKQNFLHGLGFVAIDWYLSDIKPFQDQTEDQRVELHPIIGKYVPAFLGSWIVQRNLTTGEAVS